MGEPAGGWPFCYLAAPSPRARSIFTDAYRRVPSDSTKRSWNMRPKNHLVAFSDQGKAQHPKSGRVTQLRRTLPATSGEVLYDPRASHPEYPLERLCTHDYEPFQLTFARHAQQLFHEHEDVELLAAHHGLVIRAETEEAIEAALEVLEDFYGPQIRVSPPTVRYHKGKMLEQPWMGLRVRCATDQLETVRADLVVRDATIVSSETQSCAGVIQACAPLACLIGYGAALATLTSGAGQHVMWLSHYAPVEDLPPDGDAA
jgi:hypothetical protein